MTFFTENYESTTFSYRKIACLIYQLKNYWYLLTSSRILHGCIMLHTYICVENIITHLFENVRCITFRWRWTNDCRILMKFVNFCQIWSIFNEHKPRNSLYLIFLKHFFWFLISWYHQCFFVMSCFIARVLSDIEVYYSNDTIIRLLHLFLNKLDTRILLAAREIKVTTV